MYGATINSFKNVAGKPSYYTHLIILDLITKIILDEK
jgi:hypothetical protein